ncbi:MAG: cupin domain-containing protein [Oscillospiraceae bacterium]|jgi:mannose-6-phosphate isomerase-like protein (cupin superfamily)|nr:cupin domain-containing protein [Oscillospiraceae bacterium]
MIFTPLDYRHEDRLEMRGGKGVVLYDELIPGAFPANCRVFAKLTLQPGCSIGKHTHEGETELYTFVSGTGTVMDDDMPIKVKPGYVMSTPSGHAHAVENDGDEDLVFYACIILDKVSESA